MPSRLREPVDGRARGVGPGPAGAGQRPLRRAARPDDPQPRRALLRQLRRVRRGAVHADVEPAAAHGLRRERPPLLRAPLRLAGDPAQVPATCSASCRARADGAGGARRRCPAGWPAGGGRWHRRSDVVDALAKGPVAYDEPAAPIHRRRGRSRRPPARRRGRSPVAGRQAVRSGPHGRGRRPQGSRPDRPQGERPPATARRRTLRPARPAGRPAAAAAAAGGSAREPGIAGQGRRRPEGSAGSPGRAPGPEPARPSTAAAAEERVTGPAAGGRPPRTMPPSRRPRAGRPSGAGDARLRRRHRPRGARHPEGAARRRLPLGHLRRDRRLAARGSDPRLSRPDRRGDARDHPHPPLLDRIARLPRRLRAARADGARLPQHHAAGVLRRRPSAAGGAVLPRSARAGRLRVALRAGAGRLRVQSAGAGRARLPAHRRAAGRPELRRTSTSCPNRTLAQAFDDGWTNLLFVGRVIPNKKIENVIRHFHAYKTRHNAAVAAAAGRLVGRASSATSRCCRS